MGRQVKHVAVDLDDVTVDFVGGMDICHQKEFGVPIPMGDGGTWGPDMVVFMSKGSEEIRAAGFKGTWDWLRQREWLWATFPAIDGAIGGISTLRARGLYVEAVTSKPDWAAHNVWKWLGKWRVPFHRVTIINAKGGQRKVDFTDADLIIDDKLATCIEFVEAGRNAIWFDRYDVPDAKAPNGVWIASDWREVMQCVNHITGRYA